MTSTQTDDKSEYLRYCEKPLQDHNLSSRKLTKDKEARSINVPEYASIAGFSCALIFTPVIGLPSC